MRWRYAAALLVGVMIGVQLPLLVRHEKFSDTAFAQKGSAAVAMVTSEWKDITSPDENESSFFDEYFKGEKSTTIFPVAISSSTVIHDRVAYVPVLVYHSVRPHVPHESKDQEAYDITPELLDEELRFIREKGFTTITFLDVAAYFDRGVPLPPNPVILTFDDGWKNQYVYAYPLLRYYGMKATFFVFTNPIDHKNPHWMSWQEIQELDQNGMEIGSHSKTHPYLSKIVDDAVLEKEITGSKEIIESELKHPIISFAYPFGLRNAQTVLAVARAGYRIARTIESGGWTDTRGRLEFHATLSTDNFSDFTRVLESKIPVTDRSTGYPQSFPQSLRVAGE